MRGAAAALVCVGLGFFTADALADLVPVPTVPTVTVSTPTLPVPTVSVPTVPAPAPAPTVPALPAPKPPGTTTSPALPVTTTSTPSLPGTTLTSATNPSGTPTASAGGSVPVQFSALGATSSGRGSSPSSTSSSSSASSRGPSGPQVKHFDSSRPWITTTGKNRTSTILSFVLKRPTRVIFTVEQLAPDCQTVGRFSVRGRAGLNRVRFSARVGRRQLAAGTYRITARTVNGRALQRVTIVVVDGGAPTKAELDALRASNVCSASSGVASTASTGASSTGGLSGFGSFFTPKEQPSASAPKSSGGALGGVLGSATVEKTAKAIRPGLVALLAAAILLLGLGSLPRLALADARINDALARHRTEITIVGALALIAVIVTFLVG
jgi:hypothetical protein